MSFNHTALDKTVPVPLYFQLKTLILDNIRNGTFPPGSTIPTEIELENMFSISRTTVRQAVSELVSEGWLYRVKSKGTFVSIPKIHQDFLSKVESYNSEMMRKGLTPSTDVIELKQEKADSDVSARLSVGEHAPVIFLHRLRYADREPLVIIRTYLPDDVCHFLLEKDFTDTSLYHELSISPITKVVCIQRHIEAVPAGSYDAKYLKIPKGDPVMLAVSVGYNEKKRAIEYSTARYRGDRSAFDVTVAPEP